MAPRKPISGLPFDKLRVNGGYSCKPGPTANPAVIRRADGECQRRVPLEQKLRLLGVRARGLSPANAEQEVRESGQGELPLTAPNR